MQTTGPSADSLRAETVGASGAAAHGLSGKYNSLGLTPVLTCQCRFQQAPAWLGSCRILLDLLHALYAPE